MIAKGTTHDNGGKLATYLVTGKLGERAELWQLRGFAADDDIKLAFRSVHVMAQATRCERPLFHVQVRNPEGENLTREQWERVANRIESKLGLSDQPRAIAFHQEMASGHEHMHVGWSRIDDETMTAKALPFFKLRLKAVSRELETELGLTPVPNERKGPVMAPKRNEDEQARRLGIDIRDVRDTIRECWKRSDNGGSFRAALSAEGLILARGEKRDFLAIDHEGGMHALGKRILGNTAAEIRARTVDLDRGELPTVEQAREQLASGRQTAQEKTVTHAADKAWADAIATAARELTIRPVEPEAPTPTLPPKLGPEMTESAAEIRDAYRSSSNVAEFVTALDRNGIRLAVVTEAEASRSGTHRTGEIVTVTSGGEVCQVNEFTTGTGTAKVDGLLGGIDRRELAGVEETQQRIDLETRLHIELSQVGMLRRSEPDIFPVRNSDAGEVKTPVQKTDWLRVMRDPEYRKEVECQYRERKQQAHPNERSRIRER